MILVGLHDPDSRHHFVHDEEEHICFASRIQICLHCLLLCLLFSFVGFDKIPGLNLANEKVKFRRDRVTSKRFKVSHSVVATVLPLDAIGFV